MRVNNCIQNDIIGLSHNLPNLSFKDQFEINEIVIELSSLLSDINFEILTNVRKAFDVCNDSLREIVETLDCVDKYYEQMVFMAGQISMMSKLTNNIYKSIINNREQYFDENNPFIKSIVKIIGENSVVAHKDLADKLSVQPANLTMKMKRDLSWKKYISSYVNPKKQNSVLYILNGTGKSIFKNINFDDDRELDIEHLIKLNYSNLQGGSEYEREKERITNWNFKTKLFGQGI